MSRIILARSLPPGRYYASESPFYGQIRADRLEEVFSHGRRYSEGGFAELLLSNGATAIYHLDAECTGELGGVRYARPTLLGVNYHDGHSEGRHKIIVQNIPERRGPWVLFRPPDSMEDTLYLQDMVFPESFGPEFQEEVANPLKIDKRFLHMGDPLAIFEDFKALGYLFVDQRMTTERLDEIGYFK